MKTIITLIALIITPYLCFSQVGSEVDKRQQEEIDALSKDVDALRKEISSLSAALKSEVERTRRNQNSNIASNKQTLEEKLAIQDSVLNQRMELIREEVNDAIPVGSIIAFHLPLYQLPDNWVLCDGRKINDAASIYFGKRVPNLVGYFIRGKTNSEDIDQKGGQDDISAHSHVIPSHRHEVGDHTHSFSANTNPTTPPYWSFDSGTGVGASQGLSLRYILGSNNKQDLMHWHSVSGTTGNASSGYTQSSGEGSTGLAGGHSNIPEYKALNFVIKIK